LHFLILTALKAEALPIIEVFRLRKDSKTHLYQNNNISLLITGVGRDKTKERLQNLHPIYSNFDQTIVVNMGIAGGNPDQTEIGELYRVNAIFDKKTKQSFIPDILCRHSLVELSLTTVDNSVNKNGDQFRGLVDMEGSVIFQQMSRYVSVHRLVFLKLVSDHMDIDDKKPIIDVTGLIAKKVDLIKSILLSLDHHALTNNVILSGKEFDLIQRGAAQLYLTKTQVHQLIEWSENYIKLTGNDLDKLAPYFIKKSNSKKERNHIFESIREFFSA
jgi:nucleoside phosphorylase